MNSLTWKIGYWRRHWWPAYPEDTVQCTPYKTGIHTGKGGAEKSQPLNTRNDNFIFGKSFPPYSVWRVALSLAALRLSTCVSKPLKIIKSCYWSLGFFVLIPLFGPFCAHLPLLFCWLSLICVPHQENPYAHAHINLCACVCVLEELIAIGIHGERVFVVLPVEPLLLLISFFKI